MEDLLLLDALGFLSQSGFISKLGLLVLLGLLAQLSFLVESELLVMLSLLVHLCSLSLFGFLAKLGSLLLLGFLVQLGVVQSDRGHQLNGRINGIPPAVSHPKVLRKSLERLKLLQAQLARKHPRVRCNRGQHVLLPVQLEVSLQRALRDERAPAVFFRAVEGPLQLFVIEPDVAADRVEGRKTLVAVRTADKLKVDLDGVSHPLVNKVMRPPLIFCCQNFIAIIAFDFDRFGKIKKINFRIAFDFDGVDQIDKIYFKIKLRHVKLK